jgi:hypothetical protein
MVRELGVGSWELGGRWGFKIMYIFRHMASILNIS